jgi:hypothetical protein
MSLKKLCLSRTMNCTLCLSTGIVQMWAELAALNAVVETKLFECYRW